MHWQNVPVGLLLCSLPVPTKSCTRTENCKGPAKDLILLMTARLSLSDFTIVTVHAIKILGGKIFLPTFSP